jgi:predicted RNA-binding Zn ribbon-like protein
VGVPGTSLNVASGLDRESPRFVGEILVPVVAFAGGGTGRRALTECEQRKRRTESIPAPTNHSLYFVKRHPRREWCSAGCGNRARVARHYHRHRKDARASS